MINMFQSIFDKKQKILIVDDEPKNLQVLVDILSQQGYEVMPAINGAIAIHAIQKSRPDLILLDVLMPEMNGFEVCEKLKADEHTRDIPIIFISVLDAMSNKIKGFKVGGVDYITKPFQEEEVLARVKIHLNLKKMEVTLKEKNQRLNDAERVANLGHWEMDIATGKCICSDEFYRICGLIPKEFEPNAEKGFEMIHPDDRERVSQAVQKAIETKGVYDIDKRIIRPDGSIRNIYSKGQIICDENGNPLKLVKTFQDITERKQAEEAIKYNELRFRELFDRMSSGVAIYEAKNDGSDFMFVDFNKAGEKIDRIGKENLMGKSVLDVFPGVKDFGLLEVFQRVWKTGIPENHPISFYQDNRISGWRENYIFKLPTGEIVSVYDDITKRKQAEEELQKTKEQAETANRTKSEFLANMSHEIRTPINAVLGICQILKDQHVGSLNQQQDDYLDNIIESSNRLLFLVSDILDISRVESGKIEMTPVNFCLNSFMERLSRTFVPLANKKNISIQIKVSPDVPKYLIGDEYRIEQILRNLISNAIKFTNKGMIDVLIEKQSNGEIS